MEYKPSGRSFAVDYAALGLLTERPMHGYELREQLRRGLGALWRIASSQLYSVLHRLERRDWIASHVESQTGRPSRTVYEITPSGARAFDAWVTAPVEHLRDIRVEFLAKVYFLRRATPSRVADLVDAQTGLLEELESSLTRRGRPESDDVGLDGIMLSFRQQQMRSIIEWLKENRDMLMRMEENE
ncbi:MAG: PadR family transcriptional regulator [Candidatus Bipolaricaulia bacterium]